MAYFIFLKSLRSLGEFRKNPHLKIPPKSPCANFQSLGIFKNQILFRKKFSPSLSAQPWPILFFSNLSIFPPLPHWASASRPVQPTIMAQRATGRLLPPAPKPSTAPPPAGLTPPPRSPRGLHRKRKTTASNSPSSPPINRRHSPPLFNPGNRCLQPRH
jgi:hypothetical protein